MSYNGPQLTIMGNSAPRPLCRNGAFAVRWKKWVL